MNRVRITGIVMLVVGLALVVLGVRPPQRTLTIIAGVLFVISGVLRLLRASRLPPGGPPAPPG